MFNLIKNRVRPWLLLERGELCLAHLSGLQVVEVLSRRKHWCLISNDLLLLSIDTGRADMHNAGLALVFLEIELLSIGATL